MGRVMADYDTELGQFMAGLRRMESGGNYRALNAGSGASGGYQFLDSTWGNYGGYRRAMDAPSDVQDARAKQLMTAYYQKFGTWGAVAQAWLGGPGSVGKNVTDRYTGITSNQYVNNVLSYAGLTGTGTNAPGFTPDERKYMVSAPGNLASPTSTDQPADRHNVDVQMQTLLDVLNNPPTESATGQPAAAANPADEIERRMAS
jgi:hypothetical protein